MRFATNVQLNVSIVTSVSVKLSPHVLELRLRIRAIRAIPHRTPLQQEPETLLRSGSIPGCGSTHRNAGHELSTIQLPVQPTEPNPQNKSCADGKNCSSAIHSERKSVTRTHKALVHVAGVDASCVAKAVDQSERGCALGLRSQEGVRDPSKSDYKRHVEGSWHEHHSDISGCRRGSCGC